MGVVVSLQGASDLRSPNLLEQRHPRRKAQPNDAVIAVSDHDGDLLDPAAGLPLRWIADQGWQDAES